MEVVLGSPRGFCAGVVRAIEIVELSLQQFGRPVYVRHEIVHNPHVVANLRKKGAVFVDELDQVPSGQLVIFSAHGVPPTIREKAKLRGLQVIDATCPLVTKVHFEALKYAKEGYTVILVGHRGHPETIGTSGEAPKQTIVVETEKDVQSIVVQDAEKVVVLTQTTLSVDDTAGIVGLLKARFPKLVVRNDICYATSNRQLTAKALAREVDVVIVIGARNSSNCTRLREVVETMGVSALMVNGPEELDLDRFAGISRIGIVSGASTPESLVEQVVVKLKPKSVVRIETVRENVTFSLPAELK